MNLLIFISDTMGLFKRRSPEVVQKRDTTRIFFTSDIHGSEVVFRKLLNAGKIYKVQQLWDFNVT